MAEITRRRTGEFLRELFSILMATPEGMQASDALQLLASRFTLTPCEAENYEYGARRYPGIEQNTGLVWTRFAAPDIPSRSVHV